MVAIGLIAAVICLVVANIVKVIRLSLFIKPYEKPDLKILTKPLAISNLVNLVLPFRLGNLWRVYYSGKRMTNGMSFSLATIIVEVLVDFICVAIVFLLSFCFGRETTGAVGSIIFYLSMLLVVVISTVLAFVFKKYVKRMIYGISSIFNESIQLKILKTFWYTIISVKNITNRVNKWQLVFCSLIMWVLNVAACMFIAMAMSNIDGGKVFDIFFSVNGDSPIVVAKLFENGVEDAIIMIAWCILAAVILYIMAYVVRVNYKNKHYENILPQQKFHDRLDFLRMYFHEDGVRDYVQNYLKVNHDVAIIEDYSAGSNATTMLCSKNGKTFYRKYAFSDAAEKLYEQFNWIKEHEKNLTLTKTINVFYEPGVCSYDMPFVQNAVTCFNYVHTESSKKAWRMIETVLKDLDKKYLFYWFYHVLK